MVHAGDWVDVRLLDELEARAAQPHGTYMTATVGRGRLGEVVLHRLPPRA